MGRLEKGRELVTSGAGWSPATAGDALFLNLPAARRLRSTSRAYPPSHRYSLARLIKPSRSPLLRRTRSHTARSPPSRRCGILHTNTKPILRSRDTTRREPQRIAIVVAVVVLRQRVSSLPPFPPIILSKPSQARAPHSLSCILHGVRSNMVAIYAAPGGERARDSISFCFRSAASSRSVIARSSSFRRSFCSASFITLLARFCTRSVL